MTEARLPPGPVTDPIGPREGGGGTAAEGLDSVCVGEHGNNMTGQLPTRDKL